MYQILLFLAFFSFLGPIAGPAPKKLLLLYSKSESEYSTLIERMHALKQLAADNNLTLDTARLGPKFSERNLQRYAALVFIQPVTKLLNSRQRNELERYIQAGGGLLQISLPPSSETDWSWYTRLQEAGLKAQYVKSFQVGDKNQLKYWRTAFEGGFYSQITLSNEKQFFKDSDWYPTLPAEFSYVTDHPALDYSKAVTVKIPEKNR